MDSDFSRRSFLKKITLVTAGGALATTASDAQPVGKILSTAFAGVPLTDQNGKPFNPAEAFRSGHCLVLFGYNDCAICGGTPGKPGIMDAVATIQRELLRQGKEVPIVVVSAMPADDRASMESYVTSLYAKGMKQYADELVPSNPDERRKVANKLYLEAKDKPQEGRLIHLVCPPTSKDTQNIEERMGLIINRNDPRQHSSFITIFENGKSVKAFRSIPGHMDKDPATHPARLAQAIAAEIPARPRRGL